MVPSQSLCFSAATTGVEFKHVVSTIPSVLGAQPNIASIQEQPGNCDDLSDEEFVGEDNGGTGSTVGAHIMSTGRGCGTAAVLTS